MSRVSDAIALAAVIYLSPLWRAAISTQSAGPAALWTVRRPGFGDAGHDFPGHVSAAAHLVSGDVVGDEPEKQGECFGAAKHFGSGKLAHRLGVAAQAAARDGRPGRERLSGRVEVDESYVGDEERGLRGRQTLKKALVADAAEEDAAGMGRIRMKRIRQASQQQLHGFIQEAVEPDSNLHTDGWDGYVGLEALGYRHEYDFPDASSQSASELLPRVHRVAALLKRWLMGTHQGAVSREHTD